MAPQAQHADAKPGEGLAAAVAVSPPPEPLHRVTSIRPVGGEHPWRALSGHAAPGGRKQSSAFAGLTLRRGGQALRSDMHT